MAHRRVTLKARLDKAMEGMDPYTPLSEAACGLTLVCLDEIMRNIDGTIEGKDPEYLHDMRVASRRLRAAMRVFRRCYDGSAGEIVDRARFVTGLLGLVRDLDVRMTHLENIRPLLSPRAVHAADLLIFNTNMHREEARESMVEGLGIVRSEEWHGWMRDALGYPSNPFGRRWYPSIASLPEVLRNRAAVTSTSHLARLGPATMAQHALRISVKRYRYSLEMLRFCFEEAPVEEVISICKKVQDDLGLIHDYDIMIDHIKRARSGTLPKQIKKGLDETKHVFASIRHQQHEAFLGHLDSLTGADPSTFRK